MTVRVARNFRLSFAFVFLSCGLLVATERLTLDGTLGSETTFWRPVFELNACQTGLLCACYWSPAEVKLFQLPGGTLLGSFDFDKGLFDVATHPSGDLVAVASDSLSLISKKSDRWIAVRCDSSFAQDVSALTFAADRQTLFLGNRRGDVMSTRLNPLRGDLRLKLFAGQVFDLKTSKNQKFLVALGLDEPFPELNFTPGESDEEVYRKVATFAEASRVMTCTLHVISVAQWRSIRAIRHRKAIRAFAISPDNVNLAIVDASNRITVRDLQSGAIRAHWRGDERGEVVDIDYSRNGRFLATVSTGFDGASLQVWNARTGAMVEMHEGPVLGFYSVAFVAEGRLIVGGATGQLTMFRFDDEQE